MRRSRFARRPSRNPPYRTDWTLHVSAGTEDALITGTRSDLLCRVAPRPSGRRAFLLLRSVRHAVLDIPRSCLSSSRSRALRGFHRRVVIPSKRYAEFKSLCHLCPRALSSSQPPCPQSGRGSPVDPRNRVREPLPTCFGRRRDVSGSAMARTILCYRLFRGLRNVSIDRRARSAPLGSPPTSASARRPRLLSSARRLAAVGRAILDLWPSCCPRQKRASISFYTAPSRSWQRDRAACFGRMSYEHSRRVRSRLSAEDFAGSNVGSHGRVRLSTGSICAVRGEVRG
jgi:hypothetical protein